ncbi:MAG TPA: TadE/TadG family type IV pilus assembly protein [Terracidiphilus sp.]|nr:TadE/TadG family type IV pilus assembly protein [Terracidiphilus sp.]
MKLQVTSRLPFKSRLLRAFKRELRDERGQSLVETALAMLVMLMLIFGVIEGCWAMYSFHYLANAAHEATRYAIVRGGDWSDKNGAPIYCDGSGNAGAGYGASECIASAADIANFAANRGFPGIHIDPNKDVTVGYYSSLADSTPSPCSQNSCPNQLGDIVQVTISHPFTLTLPGLPPYTWNLSSTSRMVIAQ